MSMMRRCDIYLATDGKWYMILGAYEHAYEDNQCDFIGPFASKEDAYEELNWHSNPGGLRTDHSGTQDPPKQLTMPASKRPRSGWDY